MSDPHIAMAIPLLFLKPFIFGRIRKAAACTDHRGWLRKRQRHASCKSVRLPEWNSATSDRTDLCEKKLYLDSLLKYGNISFTLWAGAAQPVQRLCYGLNGPGIESRWQARFYSPAQIGTGANPVSYTIGTRSLSRG